MANTQQYTQIDTAGGCTIKGFEGEELTLSDSHRYAVDILEAPALKVIKIKSLMAGKPPHLVLANIPNLERIELPAGHPGAVIHLNSERAPKPFTIEGLVSEIDGAWPGVQFRQTASGCRENWSRVTLRHVAKDVRTPDDAELVIMTAPAPAQVEHLTLGGHSDWLLTDIEGLSHLQINTSGYVALDQLPALRTVFSSDHRLQLSLSQTPRLKRVAGCGEILSIRQSDWKEKQLTIDGRWKHAKIASDRLEQLSFKDGRSLTVYHCSRLKVVDLALGMDIECHGALPAPLAESARFFFDEATLNHNIDALRAGEMSVLPVTLRVLGGAHEPAQVVHCLQQLAELCALGIAPEKIWECRRELSARHRNARSRRKTRGLRPLNQAAMAKADFNWHWHLPDDLGPQGWEADLEIWVYCRKTVSAAFDFGDVMAHTCQEPIALDTLIRKAGITGSDEALANLAVQAIEHYVRKNAEYMLGRHSQGSNDPLKRLTRIFKQPQMTMAQRRTLLVYLCNSLDLDRLLAAVPQLLQLAPGPVRAELMALSRKPERWFIPRIPSLRLHRTKHTVERYRSKLMQAALASARSPEEPESHEAGTNLSLFEETH